MKNKSINPAKEAVFVSVMMLCFKVIGFIKQAVIAFYFGASAKTDVFFQANSFISAISETIIKSVSVAIITVYIETKINIGKKGADKLMSVTLEMSLLFSSIMAVLIHFAAPYIALILAPNGNISYCRELTFYIRLLNPIIVIASCEMVFCAIFDANKAFLISRIRSVIYSLAVICACVFLSNQGIIALVLGQYISRIIFLVIIIFAANQFCNLKLCYLKWNDSIKKICFSSIPLFIGNGIVQLNRLIDNAICSLVSEGAVSNLYYCHILEEFVTAILVSTVGSIFFSHMTEYVVRKDILLAEDFLIRGIKAYIIVLTPISIISILCAKDIVGVVYYRGNFDYADLTQTSWALIGYALSFLFVAIRDLFAKTIYAFGNTKKPTISSIISMLLNVLLSLILVRVWGIFGITVATSISSFVGMVINHCYLKYYFEDISCVQQVSFLKKILPAASILLICGLCIKHFFGASHLVCVGLCGMIGIVVYWGVLSCSSINEVKIINNYLKNNLKRLLNLICHQV